LPQQQEQPAAISSSLAWPASGPNAATVAGIE
jgi:hypothetical protein